MYVKRHAVRRGSKRYVYLRLVQAYRDEHGRVRRRVLKTLGREDELKASVRPGWRRSRSCLAAWGGCRG
jgi:hypothetical protein